MPSGGRPPIIFGPSVQVESSNPTLPKTADDHPAEPLVRYGAMWKARFTSGSAALELHHPLGHDPRPPDARTCTGCCAFICSVKALVEGSARPG